MMLAGQSAGGMVSLFTAATRQPEGLTAVLAFAAGRGGNPARRPGVPCAMESYAQLLDDVGKQIKVPVLFHYAENDQFFGPATSKAWYDRFAAAGAKAEYVLNPSFGRDGHYVFSELNGVRYWLPAVEQFLAKQHIAFDRLDGKDPARAQFYAYDQLPNVKSASCRDMYRVFLEAPGPRAYAVSEDGRCGFAGAVAGAREAALNACAKAANGSCQLYAVDDAVVWERNRAPTTMTAGAKLPAAGATNTAVGSSRKE
jgi:hypothetical protein